jgi:ABC-2 type transport system permease protein
MTDLATSATSAPRALMPAGRHPRTVVVAQVGRKAVRSGALWGCVFALYVAVQILAYTSAYPTLADRDQLASAYGTNVGLSAVIGKAHAINTVTGYASWRVLGLLTILGAVWGLLTSTRLLRGEEDAGRTEMLLVGQTTRRRAGFQSVAGLGAALAALFALTAIGTLVIGRTASVGFSTGQSLYFSVTIVAGAATFLAIGGLTSQLASTRRRAASMAGAVFGVCYALRMVADSDAGLHWLAWLTPLGWIEQSRPLTDPRPLALLPVALLIAVAVTVTVHLAGTRDVGAAALPGRDTAAPHLALLGSPAGLAVRLTRPAVLGWLAGVAAFSVLLGTVAESSTKDVHGDRAVQQALGRVGAHGSLVAAYLGLTFLLIAVIIALVAAGQITALRAEEADGHLENLLVRSVSRASWLGGRLLLSASVLVAAGLVAGLAAWCGAASQHAAPSLGSLLAAGLNVVSPSLVLLGLGALTFGVAPRRTTVVVYAYLAWSFMLEFLGAVVHVSHWLLDTSMFFHVAPAPATSPDWASVAILAGLGAAGAVLGGVFLSRRDLVGA